MRTSIYLSGVLALGMAFAQGCGSHHADAEADTGARSFDSTVRTDDATIINVPDRAAPASGGNISSGADVNQTSAAPAPTPAVTPAAAPEATSNARSRRKGWLARLTGILML